jgi:hypothetical protein
MTDTSKQEIDQMTYMKKPVFNGVTTFTDRITQFEMHPFFYPFKFSQN